jgi:hypothetical protein
MYNETHQRSRNFEKISMMIPSLLNICYVRKSTFQFNADPMIFFIDSTLNLPNKYLESLIYKVRYIRQQHEFYRTPNLKEKTNWKWYYVKQNFFIRSGILASILLVSIL